MTAVRIHWEISMRRLLSTLLLAAVLALWATPAMAIPLPREWFWRDACGSCPEKCAPEFYMCPCFRYTHEDFGL